MRKLLIFIAFISVINAAVFEIGASGGQLFFDRDDGTGKKEYMRFNLFAGYQFHETSDQIGVAIRSDKYVDEIDLNYMFVLPTFRKYTPFRAMPYLKPSIGTGNTYADNNTLSHLSYAAAIGLHGKVSQKFRARFEMEYRSREWQLDRGGGESNIKPTTFNDTEIGFYFGIGYLF